MIKTATPRLEHSATTVRKRASITRPLWAFSHVPAAHLVASHADICGSALFPVRTDCDANFVGGVWCWEHDTVEANRFAMQVAPHQCVAPPGRYIAQCDRAGAARNSYVIDPKALCPGADCLIDSRKAFRHVQTFVAEGDPPTLASIENRLEQGGRVFTFNATSDRAYLSRMSEALRTGLVLTFQVWGGPRHMMSWLDGMTECTGECPASAHAVFSHVTIASAIA